MNIEVRTSFRYAPLSIENRNQKGGVPWDWLYDEIPFFDFLGEQKLVSQLLSEE
jgi:hypothetical protein